MNFLTMEYWRKRCQLAEKCLDESPCDPDITDDQIEAHKEWEKFISKCAKEDKKIMDNFNSLNFLSNFKQIETPYSPDLDKEGPKHEFKLNDE